jgi:hypothetical protein
LLSLISQGNALDGELKCLNAKLHPKKKNMQRNCSLKPEPL